MKKLQTIGQLEWLRNKVTASTAAPVTRVYVCMTGCRAYGAAAVMEALQEEVKRPGPAQGVEIRATG